MLEELDRRIVFIITLIIALSVYFYISEGGDITIFSQKKAGEDYTPQAPTVDEAPSQPQGGGEAVEEQQVELYELRVFRIKQTILNNKKIDYSYIVLKSPMPIKLAPSDVGVVFNGQDERVLKVKEIENGTYYYVIYFEVHNIKPDSTVEVFYDGEHYTFTAPVKIEYEEQEKQEKDNYNSYELLITVNTDNPDDYSEALNNVEGLHKGFISALNSYVFNTKDDSWPEIAVSFVAGGTIDYYTDEYSFKAQQQHGTLLRAEGFKYRAGTKFVTVRRDTIVEDNQIKVFVEARISDSALLSNYFTVGTIYSLESKTISTNSETVFMLIDKYLYRISPQGIKKVQFTDKNGVLVAFLFKDSQGNPIIIWSDGEKTYYVKYSADLSRLIVKKSLPGVLVRAGWTVWTGRLNFEDRFRIYVIIKDEDNFKTLLINQETDEVQTGWFGALIPVNIPYSFVDENDGITSTVQVFELLTIKTDSVYLSIIPIQTAQVNANFFIVLMKADGSFLWIRGAGNSVEEALCKIEKDAVKLGVNIHSLLTRTRAFNQIQIEELNKNFRRGINK